MLATLSAETGTSPAALTAAAVTLCAMPPPEPRPDLVRRYWGRQPSVAAISFGRGAVVSATASLTETVARVFAGASRDQVFEPARLAALDTALRPHGQQVYGPYPRLLCGRDTLRRREAPPGIEVALEVAPPEARIETLEPTRWPNAISPRRSVPTAALAVATSGDAIAGVAAASTDNALLWQIGIDVAQPHQGRGVGAALTATLARHILEASGVPFYGAATVNLPSISTAIAAGFRLAWMEAFSAPAGRW